jgi:SHAQKYF class myb-like DNA-binding protein
VAVFFLKKTIHLSEARAMYPLRPDQTMASFDSKKRPQDCAVVCVSTSLEDNVFVAVNNNLTLPLPPSKRSRINDDDAEKMCKQQETKETLEEGSCVSAVNRMGTTAKSISSMQTRPDLEKWNGTLARSTGTANNSAAVSVSSHSSSSPSPSPPPPVSVSALPWTADMHRDFVGAVWKLGISECSPASIFEEMIQRPEGLNGERLKSRLQKFRKYTDKEEQLLFSEYDREMMKSCTDEKHPLGLKKEDTYDSICGGEAIAALSKQVMACSDDFGNDKKREGIGRDTTTQSPWYAVHLTAAEFTQTFNAAAAMPSRIPQVSLTPQEQESDLGRAMQVVTHKIQALADHLALFRHRGATSQPCLDVDMDPVDILIMAQARNTTFHRLGEGIPDPIFVPLPTIDATTPTTRSKKKKRSVSFVKVPVEGPPKTSVDRPPCPPPLETKPGKDLLALTTGLVLDCEKLGDAETLRFGASSPIHGIMTPDQGYYFFDDPAHLQSEFLPPVTLPSIVSPCQSTLTIISAAALSNNDAHDATLKDPLQGDDDFLNMDAAFAWDSLAAPTFDPVFV